MTLRRDVSVRLGKRTYAVRVGCGVLADIGALVDEWSGGLRRIGTLVVVTNSTVAKLYGETVTASLMRAGAARLVTVELPDGEQHKTLASVERIYDQALESGVDRSSLVVALGGGVVGDLSGFAAATLLRGIRLVMIPTTLLAQVDSSVGGKTGVNRPQGKNLVGAFHQPSLVVADPDTLRTLPDREYRAGLAEVVKYGVILDGELFDKLETHAWEVGARDADVMTDVIARCVELKAFVVERDENETGLRRILNFGHTVGHAIEQATGYERFLHGEAVAIGMMAAARISQRVGACSAEIVARLERLLSAFGLPTEIPGDVERGRIERAVALDKKAQRDAVAFIVCTAIGACREQALVPAAIVAQL